MKQTVLVSDEMITLVGRGAVPAAPCPNDAVIFHCDHLTDGASPQLSYRDHCDLDHLEETLLALVVKRAACERLFALRLDGPRSWHLPSALAELALSIIDCKAHGEAQTALRLARSIELLCQIHAALADGSLVGSTGDGGLSESDVARIAAARRVVDQRWHEKLTIADLSRAAGVNRDKLARGFRDIYGATVTEILSERRLSEARRLLLVSDLPVSTVAYRCSYLNNASFTRAFTRRFGLPPSELRRTGVAA
jgi:AraC family transcriptional regulator, transcriptional activator of the genes for pyochelin and ferripyochelin receptors